MDDGRSKCAAKNRLAPPVEEKIKKNDVPVNLVKLVPLVIC